YKMKQYLKFFGKQEETIDARFVTFVLNIIYQPCNTSIVTNENVSIPMPENFISMVKECQGMPDKLTRDYASEIKAIQDELQDYEENFWGYSVKPQEPSSNKPLSPQKFAKSIEAFKNKTPPPTDEELANYEQIGRASCRE